MVKREEGFTLIELLVVVAIIGILSGIAFVSISGARESAYDTQIKSELGQIRSNAEMWYYDNGGSYNDYETSDGWSDMADALPPCSAAIHSDLEYNPVGEYQIDIETGDYAQSYLAWAALCAESTEGTQVFYCIDSDGNALETEQDPNENANRRDDYACPEAGGEE